MQKNVEVEKDPIFYILKKLNKDERKNSATEQESLAVILVINHVRDE